MTAEHCCFPGRRCSSPAMHEPTDVVWSRRNEFPNEVLYAINPVVLMCIEKGVLKIDMNSIDKFEKDTPERAFLDNLVESMMSNHIPTTRYKNDTNNTEAGTRDGCLVVKRSDFDGKPSTRKWVSSRKREAEQHNVRTKLHTTDRQLCGNHSEPASPNRTAVEATESLEVPSGVCGGDKLAVIDKQGASTFCIAVPDAAYVGMQLGQQADGKLSKILLLDGSGYKIGGSVTKQHSTRLAVHRRLCNRDRCMVLGCIGDAAFDMFKDVNNDDVNAYHAHVEAVSLEHRPSLN